MFLYGIVLFAVQCLGGGALFYQMSHYCLWDVLQPGTLRRRGAQSRNRLPVLCFPTLWLNGLNMPLPEFGWVEGERGWARPRGCARFLFPSDTPHPLPSPSVRESHQELLFYMDNIHLLLPIYLCLHSFYFFELFVIELLHPEKYLFCILISVLLLVVSYLMFI